MIFKRVAAFFLACFPNSVRNFYCVFSERVADFFVCFPNVPRAFLFYFFQIYCRLFCKTSERDFLLISRTCRRLFNSMFSERFVSFFYYMFFERVPDFLKHVFRTYCWLFIACLPKVSQIFYFIYSTRESGLLLHVYQAHRCLLISCFLNISRASLLHVFRTCSGLLIA